MPATETSLYHVVSVQVTSLQKAQLQHVHHDTRDDDLSAIPRSTPEDPRVSSVLERLGHLEGRVGQQLDHLLHAQEQQACTSHSATSMSHVIHTRNARRSYLVCRGYITCLCTYHQNAPSCNLTAIAAQH